MNLFFLSPEVWPFARVGGLAEVSHDLPRTLAARGHRVQVVTLKGRMAPEVAETLEPTGITLEVPISWHKYQGEVF
jgi:starch synthase